MNKKQTTWKEQFGFKLLPDRREVKSIFPPASLYEPEYENISAMVGFLVLAGTFWLGINVGLFFANLLKSL